MTQKQIPTQIGKNPKPQKESSFTAVQTSNGSVMYIRFENDKNTTN